MPTTTENDESKLLDAFAQGQLHSFATKGELAKFRAAAHATCFEVSIYADDRPLAAYRLP